MSASPRLLRRRSTVTCIGAVFLALVAPADAAPRAKHVGCSAGRFVVSEGQEQVGAGSPVMLVLDGKRARIEGACPAVGKVRRSKRAGTTLSIRWRGCGSASPLRLKAVARDCDAVSGTLRARKRRIAFAARPSTCGDGVLDRIGGEGCDGDQGCELPARCGATCACETVASGPTTTTTLPPTAGPPAWEALLAAWRALAAGADDVAVDPQGRLRYRRTRSAGERVREVLLRDGLEVVSWEHAADGDAGAVDADGDGQPDWQSTVTRAADGSPLEMVVLASPKGRPARRETVTFLAGGQVRVRVEERGPSGFVAVDEYDASSLQEADGGTAASPMFEGCGSAEAGQAQTALAAGIFVGLECLQDLGLDAEAALLTAKLVADGVRLTCDPSTTATDCAQMSMLDALTSGRIAGPLDITVFPNFFDPGKPACANQSMVLFHELLHAALGAAHSPLLNRGVFSKSQNGLASDRVYSCADLCFRADKATREECGTCLGVEPCDLRCDAYQADGVNCSTTTTTTVTSTTATTSTSTTIPDGWAIDILDATCKKTPCSRGSGQGVNGEQSIATVTLTASGPFGATLDYNNTFTFFYAPSFCGDWSKTGSYCRRDASEPAQVTMSGTCSVPTPVAYQCDPIGSAPSNPTLTFRLRDLMGALKVTRSVTVSCN